MRALDSQSDVKSSAWLGRQSIEEYCNLINIFLYQLTRPRTSCIQTVVIALWPLWPSVVITTPVFSVWQLPFGNISLWWAGGGWPIVTSHSQGWVWAEDCVDRKSSYSQQYWTPCVAGTDRQLQYFYILYIIITIYIHNRLAETPDPPPR